MRLIFQSFQLFLTRAHYAFGKTKLPLIINLISAGSTVLLSLIMVNFISPTGSFISYIAKYLKVDDLGRLMVLSLPLSFSLGAVLSAYLLWFYMDKDIKKVVFPSIMRSFFDSLVTAVFIGFATVLSLHILQNFFNLDYALGVFLHGLFSGTIGIAVGIGFMILFKNREFKEIKQKFL